MIWNTGVPHLNRCFLGNWDCWAWGLDRKRFINSRTPTHCWCHFGGRRNAKLKNRKVSRAICPLRHTNESTPYSPTTIGWPHTWLKYKLNHKRFFNYTFLPSYEWRIKTQLVWIKASIFRLYSPSYQKECTQPSLLTHFFTLLFA